MLPSTPIQKHSTPSPCVRTAGYIEQIFFRGDALSFCIVAENSYAKRC